MPIGLRSRIEQENQPEDKLIDEILLEEYETNDPVKKYQLTLVRSELLRTIDTLVLAPFHLMGFLTQRQWVGCLLLAQQRLSIAVF